MTPSNEWIKDRYFNGFLVEESLVLLFRDKFFLNELGLTYHNTITVKNVGDFLLRSEEDMMIEAKKKRLRPEFDFINKINVLEEKIHAAVADEAKDAPEDYYHIFELMSEHLAYYGLGKEEAVLIFNDPTAAQQDKDYVEAWRNNKERWNSHDVLWERISRQIGVPVEVVHVMQIDEIMRALRHQPLDLESIQKRVNSTWSIVEKDGTVTIHLEDMSPDMGTGVGAIAATNQPKESKGAHKHAQAQLIQGRVAHSSPSHLIVTGIVGTDILVAKKTHPDMMEEIRRSAGVITDEGGILSHAAITCRELKIPCIVGTSNASEMLKDGDRIEMDMTTGIIRVV